MNAVSLTIFGRVPLPTMKDFIVDRGKKHNKLIVINWNYQDNRDYPHELLTTSSLTYSSVLVSLFFFENCMAFTLYLP